MRVEVRDGRGFCGFGARGLCRQVSFCFDLREGERDGVRVAEFGEGVDPGTAGIAEAEELGDFIEGFSGSVVDGAADEGVGPDAVGGLREKKVSVAAGDDEGEGRFGIGIRAIPGLKIETGAPVFCACVADSRSCRRTAWMWPSRWLTAISGRLLAKARALA